MKRLLVLLLGMTALAAPAPSLEPRVHFVHGWAEGDGLKLYYQIPLSTVPNDPFGAKPGNSAPSIKTVTVTGLPLKNWRIVDSFGKSEIELSVDIKTGLDATFSSLKINGSSVAVAPSRVLYLKPERKYPLSFEKLEQQPTSKLLFAMRIFNDSPEVMIIEKILYAPKGVSSERVLLTPRYDSEFFNKLENWSASSSKTLPDGVTMTDSSKVNLKILPSRGFGAAIIGSSLTMSCPNPKRTRDPAKRYDTFISQPIIQYRLGSGKPAFYPIPDQIISDICP